MTICLTAQQFLSKAKEYEIGYRNYCYKADLELLVPDGHILNWSNLFVDEEPIDLSMAQCIDQNFPENRICIRGLELKHFGNRIPEFAYRETGWKEKARD